MFSGKRVNIRGMKVIVLYHPYSEEARIIEEFARDFARQRGHEIELASLESRDGSATASLYDIVRYPAMIVLTDDGRMQKYWDAQDLPPLMDELAGYLTSRA